MATGPNQKSWAVQLGDRLSAVMADVFAHPYMQAGVILFCVVWFALRLRTDLLTAALSILAITLTQMVLNRQNEREIDAHRRDVAMHAKLDELVIAVKGARNEMAGIEELDEPDIEVLKKEVVEAIEEAGEAAGDQGEREAAKKAVKEAVDKEVKPRARRNGNGKRSASNSRE